MLAFKKLFNCFLLPSPSSFIIPKHIAIIMDGNRRWAKNKSLDNKLGHYKGAKNLKNIISHIFDLNVKYLTVYAFSTENWHRSKKEVKELIELLNEFLNSELEEFIKKEIKVKIFGDLSKFSHNIIKKINNLENETRHFKNFQVNIALNYGSREEIIHAFNKYIENNSITGKLNEKKFKNYLYSNNVPDPDFIIRTGGEYRLSNFLLWQSAYAELYFSKKHWPEFNKRDLYKALSNYSQRKRRFGH